MASSKRRSIAITSVGDSVLSKKKIKFSPYNKNWVICRDTELAKKIIDYATLVNEQRVIVYGNKTHCWQYGRDMLWITVIPTRCPCGIYKRTDNTPELERETLALIEEFNKLLEE